MSGVSTAARPPEHESGDGDLLNDVEQQERVLQG
jgi:hypothetical protein